MAPPEDAPTDVFLTTRPTAMAGIVDVCFRVNAAMRAAIASSARPAPQGMKTDAPLSFGPARGVAKNLPQFRRAGHPFFAHFRVTNPPGHRLSFSARQRTFYFNGGLRGTLTCTGLLQGLPVVPRHPGRRVLHQLRGVFL